RGSDVVFHLAAHVETGDPDPETMERINVGGTRKVFRLAQELGIPRIVFTSTTAVFGDTKGQMVDESFHAEEPALTEHARTKWLAHYQVVEPLMREGVPIIIVMPGGVYGPGGSGLITDMMRMFYRGYPIVSGADTVFTFAHVADIAEGHILAAEKGKVGETYILSGPAVPLGDMLDFWAYLTGVRAPKIRVPAVIVRHAAPIFNLLGRITGLESAFSHEGALTAGGTYIARSDKARKQLGWETRPLQRGMLETLNWIASDEAKQHDQMRWREKQLGALSLLSAVLLMIVWLSSRRRSKGS
ncbi:MAG: NAD-dependent epimerase/dehydratase family protein, partial [Candidatus Promineifilaceae bacterium]